MFDLHNHLLHCFVLLLPLRCAFVFLLLTVGFWLSAFVVCCLLFAVCCLLFVFPCFLLQLACVVLLVVCMVTRVKAYVKYIDLGHIHTRIVWVEISMFVLILF